VNQSVQWEAAALGLLRGVPGVEGVDTAGALRSGLRVDGIVRFAGLQASVVFEAKRRINAGAVWQLIEHSRRLGADTGYIVVVEESTAEARALLARHGIGLIESRGYAHVELPGLLVHKEPCREAAARPTRPAAPRLAGKAGVAAQALLLEPEREWKVADVAGVAGVSVGLAHRVLARLEGENILIAQGAGPRRTRRLVNPRALLDLWAEEAEAARPRRTGSHVLARTPDERNRMLAAALDAAEIHYAITGAAAAAMLTPLATAIPITEIWAPTDLLVEDVLAAASAEPVDEGANVVVLQEKGDAGLAFARRQENIAIANVFRLYADLRRDPRRGREQAANLREKVIGF